MNTQTLEIRLRPLHAIKPLPGNAKRHDLTDIKASIRKFGFIDPIGVNPETDHDLDGNGRLEALKSLYAEGGSAPKNIIVKNEKPEDGGKKKVPMWYVPTVDLPFDRETEQIVALRLNRSNEKGGYDQKAVLDILAQAQAFDRLDETGYDKSAYDELAAQFAPPPQSASPHWEEENAPVGTSKPSGSHSKAGSSAGERPLTPPAPPPPPETRSVQFFLSADDHQVFLARLSGLMESNRYETDEGRSPRNISELIFCIVRDAAGFLEVGE